VKLAGFEAAGRPRWTRIAALLAALERGESEGAAELPALYRQLCQDLALARERQLSGSLVAELNELALAGHRLLYQARTGQIRGLGAFLARDFPRAVRGEWRLVAVLHALFYGLALALAALAWTHPDLIYSFLDPANVQEMEAMYDPAGPVATEARGAGTDASMFGFYIWNNISIAFRTFASGLVLGVGTLASVILNALNFGLIASHLIREGSAQPFFTFVIAHASFELTAILLSGVAGMRLGLAVLAPGPRSRVAALRHAAHSSLPIVAGAAVMLLIAAAIEAFWSPRLFPAPIKYAVGASLWGLVALWLLAAGRARAD
jgi:uncharacterized membrane protein SpoIIM required for sporulation